MTERNPIARLASIASKNEVPLAHQLADALEEALDLLHELMPGHYPGIQRLDDLLGTANATFAAEYLAEKRRA